MDIIYIFMGGKHKWSGLAGGATQNGVIDEAKGPGMSAGLFRIDL
jgi:hypothetical protein